MCLWVVLKCICVNIKNNFYHIRGCRKRQWKNSQWWGKSTCPQVVTIRYLGVLDCFLCICPFLLPFSDAKQNPVNLEARIAQLQNDFLIADVTVAACDWIHGLLQYYQWGNDKEYCKAWQCTVYCIALVWMQCSGLPSETQIWGFWFFRFICDVRVSWALPHKLLICRTEMWDHNLNKEKTQTQAHLSLGPACALILQYFDQVCVCVCF